MAQGNRDWGPPGRNVALYERCPVTSIVCVALTSFVTIPVTCTLTLILTLTLVALFATADNMCGRTAAGVVDHANFDSMYISSLSLSLSLSPHNYMYIYIYIYRERERAHRLVMLMLMTLKNKQRSSVAAGGGARAALRARRPSGLARQRGTGRGRAALPRAALASLRRASGGCAARQASASLVGGWRPGADSYPGRKGRRPDLSTRDSQSCGFSLHRLAVQQVSEFQSRKYGLDSGALNC